MYQELNKKIDWNKCNNLLPTIIQNAATLEVLMLGFVNQEALQLTISSQKVHFYSRTKQRIWMKGEESKNYLNVKEIKIDCDNDTLLILVNPIGNTCHNGTKSCFKERTNFLAVLEEIIADRIDNNHEGYISSLYNKGINKIAQKVGEEGVETTIAAISEGNNELLNESADLLFHLMIALKARQLKLNDVIEVLQKRNK